MDQIDENNLDSIWQRWQRTWLPLRRHASEFRWVALISIILVTIILYLTSKGMGANFGEYGSKEKQWWALCAVIVGVGGGIVRLYWERANLRVGTADALASDILSIGRVFLAGDIIGDFARLSWNADSAGSAPKPRGFADIARSENYFTVFEANLSEIRGLPVGPVSEVTAFYTMLKGSRDATGALAGWPHQGRSTQPKRDVANIIYMCLLCAEHGRRAVAELMEDNFRRALFRILELRACEVLSGGLLDNHDLRYRLVLARVEKLRGLIDEATKLGALSGLSEQMVSPRH